MDTCSTALLRSGRGLGRAVSGRVARSAAGLRRVNRRGRHWRHGVPWGLPHRRKTRVGRLAAPTGDTQDSRSSAAGHSQRGSLLLSHKAGSVPNVRALLALGVEMSEGKGTLRNASRAGNSHRSRHKPGRCRLRPWRRQACRKARLSS